MITSTCMYVLPKCTASRPYRASRAAMSLNQQSTGCRVFALVIRKRHT